MKRRILRIIIASTLSLAMVIPGAASVTAQTTASLVMWLAVSPGATYSDGTLYYTVTLSNLDTPGAKGAIVDVYFHPPGSTGEAAAYSPRVLIDSGRRIDVGKTVTYNWDGQDDALARPVLAVDLGAIPVDPGAVFVYAASEYDGQYVHTPVYRAYEIRSIKAGTIRQDVQVSIAASTETVSSGDAFDLTVTKSNKGGRPLTSVSVTVNDGTSDVAVLEEPPDSGDANGDGVLDRGETWTWTIAGATVDAQTTFTANGYGEDSLGNPVTYPGHAGQRASITVSVDVTGPDIMLIKLVNGEHADTPPGSVAETGSIVTFDFVVTNTGDVDLAPVVVSDDDLGDIGSIPSLSPGESRTLSTTAAALAGQHSNLGTATGTSPTGVEVSDSDTAHYYGSVTTAPPSGSEPRAINRPAIVALWLVIGAAIIAGAVIFVRRRGI